MGYEWTKIEVFNNGEYLGSFYTNAEKKSNLIKEINEKFGLGLWTKFNIGN